MAFCELPLLGDFVAVRKHQSFRLREEFEARADEAHDAFMHARGWCAGAETQAHVRLFTENLRDKELRDASSEEIADVTHMLSKRGVAPVPASVMQEAQRRHGSSA